jgi:hypothetical protein
VPAIKGNRLSGSVAIPRALTGGSAIASLAPASIEGSPADATPPH